MVEKTKIVFRQRDINQEAKKSAIINFLINSAIAYFALQGATSDGEGEWGARDYAQDIFLTGFILCAILGALYISIYRKKNESRPLFFEEYRAQSLNWLFPYNPMIAALIIGGLGVAIAAPLMLAGLMLFGFEALTPVGYAIIKGCWAAALAGIVVPISIKQGLRVRAV
ncbi:hypothetical protein [Zhongshania sp.]|jgi:hypothetical protein|uniref:hypothetical protein n=1 Tax=Zhongshania sp. TaxID=1971902 RepID=UPI002A822AB7|nr:hypothetical protein [Zhongshania sp.]